MHFRKRVTIWSYIRILIAAFAALLLLGVIAAIFGWPEEDFTTTIREFWYIVPFMLLFMVFYHISRRVFDRGYTEQNEAQDYLIYMSKRVRHDLKFGKEEFGQLREDERFQKFFQDAYEIFQKGETPELSYDDLADRFTEEDLAYEPAQLIIEQTKRLRQKYKTDKSSKK